MPDLKNLLVEQLQDLLSAENQIVGALPKMVEAANCDKLKEAFEKHLAQTEGHVERLNLALQTLGEAADSKACKGMKGILEEGAETIDETEDEDEISADLALIAAAQKVEHYEVSAYGSAKSLAKQLGEREVAKLLSRTLGEEEATDFILTALSDPLLQEATSMEFGNGTKMPWGEPGQISARSSSSMGSSSSGSSTSSSSTERRSFAAAAGESRGNGGERSRTSTEQSRKTASTKSRKA